MPDCSALSFEELARRLLVHAERLVEQWLPGGRRRGAEYVCGNLGGGAGNSLRVNLSTGRWADFATGQCGGDLTSLYAAIHGITQGQAAQRLQAEFVMATTAPPPPVKRAARKSANWQTIVPVPPKTPKATFNHYHYTEPAATWEYRFDGKLYGYVVRFITSDGGKEILPLTWCLGIGKDDVDMRAWRWKQWDAPRPLYVPFGALSERKLDRTVVIVEGEKCAQAGHHALGTEYDFVSWPGGCRSWNQAAWDWIAGRTVVLWPDCDAHRRGLSRTEREAGVDPMSKPLKPAKEQPGIQTMRELAQHLETEHRCTAHVCDIPEPGSKPAGWDIADAIAEGWSVEDLRSVIELARRRVDDSNTAVEDGSASAEASSTRFGDLLEGEGDQGGGGMPPPTEAPIDDDDGSRRQTWRDLLLREKKRGGGIAPVRENVVLALNGNPALGVEGIKEAAGVIALNEFSGDIIKLRPTPWGTPEGAWVEVDELLMGQWLANVHKLPSMRGSTLMEGVQMVAYHHRFHPVRAYLRSLKWDGVPRLETWLRRACLEEDEWDDGDPLIRYLALAGKYFLMGMCVRVLEPVRENGIAVRGPGTKFDYVLVLESREQGRFKSSLFRLLGGEWFADTGLNLDNKDSYQQLLGRWIYEMPEFKVMGHDDIDKLKAFIASPSDYFRGTYDKRARDHLRQTLIGATTNRQRYLRDATGNRRFWGVWVTRRIDVEWVAENRDQLFAEAVARLDAGKRFFPTPDEETELFVPQQNARLVEESLDVRVIALLYPSAAAAGTERIDRITVVEILFKLGIGLDKLGSDRFRENQVVNTLQRLGWFQDGTRDGNSPNRGRYWHRPLHEINGTTPEPSPTQGTTTRTDKSACPF